MKLKRLQPSQAEEGFTLIELSIVLVIIGLIIGGVLVGRDLIEAANIRATVSQYEKFNTAAHAFQLKYGYLPGDLPNSANFGFTAISSVLLEGMGVTPGNGLIESTNGAAEASNAIPAQETTQFWRQLFVADLINSPISDPGDGPPVLTQGEVGNYFPPAKIGNNNFWVVYNDGSFNYYELTGLTGVNGAYNYPKNYLTPLQAFAIDQKIDDGLPGSGTVMASISLNWNDYGINHLAYQYSQISQYNNGNYCLDITVSKYNTATSNAANTPACSLQLKLQ